MTDEEITEVLTSVVALKDKLTQRDLNIMCRISVIRKQTEKSSLCIARKATKILENTAAIKDLLTPKDIKIMYRILAAHGQPPKCSSCDRPITDFRLFSWDHVFAKSIGGPDDIKNMTPMCVSCNVKKGSHIEETCLCHVESEMLRELEPKYNIRPPRAKKQKPGVARALPSNVKEKKTRRNHILMRGWTADCLAFRR